VGAARTDLQGGQSPEAEEAIAVAVLVEKVVPGGDVVGRLAGVALVAAGVLLVARVVVG
jgi:hypothetical protein